jgi:hypothetical protein
MRVVMDLVASHTSAPALSVDESRLRQAVLKVLRDWLDMGVDGVRLDGMRHLAEREGLSCEKLPEHAIVKELRELIDQHYPDRVLLADTNQPTEDLAAYFGDGDECHLAFNISLMPRLLMAFKQEDRRPVAGALRRWPEIPASCQWALSLRSRDNLSLEQPTDFERAHMHEDYPSELRIGLKERICRRPAPLVENDRRRVKLAYGLLFSLPGSPIVYYGNEIGMGDNSYAHRPGQYQAVPAGHRLSRARLRHLRQSEWVVVSADSVPVGLAAYKHVESDVRVVHEFLLDPRLESGDATRVADLTRCAGWHLAPHSSVSVFQFIDVNGVPARLTRGLRQWGAKMAVSRKIPSSGNCPQPCRRSRRSARNRLCVPTR